MVGEKNEPTTNNSTSHSNLSTKFGEVKKQGYIWDFNLNSKNGSFVVMIQGALLGRF